jgi:exportin-1
MFLQAQLKLVIDSIVWAFRHTERNIADTGAHLALGSPAGSRWCAASVHEPHHLSVMRGNMLHACNAIHCSTTHSGG